MKNNIKKLFLSFVLVLTLLSFGGCIGRILDAGPAPDRVLLNINNEKVRETPLPYQVLVPIPELGFDLDTDNIALIFDGNLVRYLSGAKWSSPAPRLIQRLVLDSLETSNILNGVLDETSGIFPDYRLTVSVREFQFTYPEVGGIPTASVTFHLRIINTRDASILGSTQITKSTKATDRTLRSMIIAMESSMSEVLKETNSFVENTFSKTTKKKK
ncbi:ABC-type transport auxiliary lipoprotein family protein [Desulfovibrio litoralis]|uniref:Cholesterol transport system auxiliary component n=1 Tax=Desulfovibrio litoralis DSM 11393 TaxID=1121455 RepID=A0A1M7RRH8_9BACT|nr:ABC-type transport auxiliary lipoprotein family protein [Desulfovibrio litoralis]SHN48885.1 cholesterol transport system auxiliary component [Desulfovibrio litoralis DSM 11393]